MIALAFTVPGVVRGKGRPRFVRATGRTYTDAQTASYENLVKLCALQAVRELGLAEPLDAPVCVTMTARLAPAASASRKARAAMLSGEVPPAKKPDADNLAKILDGLNGVAWNDDAQVVSLFIRKIYAETPGLDIVIRPYRAAPVQEVAA
jgi:Holliday junction resolvase RusA-like endonuclease